MHESDPFKDQEDELVRALEPRFVEALELKDAGRFDDAEDALRSILKLEPRLAEPRLELARLLLDTDRLDEAEEQARAGLESLQSGGQWTDDLPEEVILALAHALLAEVLRRRADEDRVIFGDPGEFRRIVAESREHFETAARLDPSDAYASYHAFFLGPRGHGAPPPTSGEDGDDA